MDTDLRIPLTAEQKAIIDDATADEPEGKAAWARAILLRQAMARIRERAGPADRKRSRRAGGGIAPRQND
jgi:hypothetical protein